MRGGLKILYMCMHISSLESKATSPSSTTCEQERAQKGTVKTKTP